MGHREVVWNGEDTRWFWCVHLEDSFQVFAAQGVSIRLYRTLWQTRTCLVCSFGVYYCNTGPEGIWLCGRMRFFWAYKPLFSYLQWRIKKCYLILSSWGYFIVFQDVYVELFIIDATSQTFLSKLASNAISILFVPEWGVLMKVEHISWKSNWFFKIGRSREEWK